MQFSFGRTSVVRLGLNGRSYKNLQILIPKNKCSPVIYRDGFWIVETPSVLETPRHQKSFIFFFVGSEALKNCNSIALKTSVKKKKKDSGCKWINVKSTEIFV